MFTVVLGTNDRSDQSSPGRVEINSTVARTHPEWLTVSNNWIDYDLGVITLPSPVPLSAVVQPACLPTLADTGNSYSG